ncbi:MAG: hypothetical protein AAB907_00250 [Patescibacteria group bacterium]
MEKLDIEKFNPTVAEIQKVVDDGKSIIVTDFTDKGQIKLVRDQRLKLKDIRVNITKQGKMFRQQAVDFSKAVISKEKELISLVEPEEERFSVIEDQATAFEKRERRRELLPKRRSRLIDFKDVIDGEISDDMLLDMDGAEFEGYCNRLFAEKNERNRIELEAKEKAIFDEKMRLLREQEIKEAEDRARNEERKRRIERENEAERARDEERKRTDKAEADLKVQREREDQERKERIEREERERKDRAEREEREAKERAAAIEREAKERVEREERERKEKAEAEAKAEAERKEKLAKDTKYQEFLIANGWTKEKASEFYVEVKGNTYSLYKKIGEITL